MHFELEMKHKDQCPTKTKFFQTVIFMVKI